MAKARRPRHPKKVIEAAIRQAEERGWRCIWPGGHAWGILLCPLQRRDGCRVSIFSTPKVPQNHAEAIRRRVDDCPHREEE